MISYMHRADASWEKSDKVLQAIKMVKDSEAKLIWCRDLWPYYKNEGIKLSEFFDPDYYTKEILAIRSEAKKIGADFVCLDNEAYGNSIMKYYLKNSKKLTREELDKLRTAIEKTVATVGKVDFTMHAGWSSRPCFALLAQLGNNRICEETYWFDEKRYKTIRYPYEIFGVYVNTVRENKQNPNQPYFLISDIFERSKLWADKKGLFLYSDGKNSLKVAKALCDYSKTLTQRSTNP
jgi:hypothetical protein